jgi:hypothetical protein
MVEVLGFEPNQDKTNRFTVCRASPSAPNLHGQGTRNRTLTATIQASQATITTHPELR